MRRFIVAIGSVAFAVVAPAQQAMQCVNPDVLNSLVFNGQIESRLIVSRALPANPAGFRAPAGFTLIGSGTRGVQLPGTIVAYRTTLEPGVALDSVVRLLSGEGWSREVTPAPQLPGIAVTGPQPASATLCRNGERRNVTVQDIEGVRYATIAGGQTPGRVRACGEANAQPPGFGNPMAAMAAVRALMPQFSLPATARMVPGSGGEAIDSSNEIASSMRIESPDSAQALVRLLARQLQDQGWRSDAEWQGALSTGSTWRKSDAGQTYWGKLEILALGERNYDVGFSVARN